MMNKKLVLFVSVLFLSMAILTSTLFAEEKEVKIGVLYPLSGAAATIGRDLQRAAELTAEIINNKRTRYFFIIIKTLLFPGIIKYKTHWIF